MNFWLKVCNIGSNQWLKDDIYWKQNKQSENTGLHKVWQHNGLQIVNKMTEINKLTSNSDGCDILAETYWTMQKTWKIALNSECLESTRIEKNTLSFIYVTPAWGDKKVKSKSKKSKDYTSLEKFDLKKVSEYGTVLDWGEKKQGESDSSVVHEDPLHCSICSLAMSRSSSGTRSWRWLPFQGKSRHQNKSVCYEI